MRTRSSVTTGIRTGHRWLARALGGLLLLLPGIAWGLGARIPNQDPDAIARGNAFAATADNPAAIYYNPAGISQLDGQQIHVGSLFYLNIYTDYESPAGERTDNITRVIPVPELHYSLSLKSVPVSFGLGVYAPFGLGMEWPDDAPFRNAGLEVRLKYFTVNPVVAWKPHPTLALAIGPTFNYSEAFLRQGILVSPYQFHFKGTDLGYGLTAGLLWQPVPQWSFGAKYMSSTTLDYGGLASFRPDSVLLPPATHTEAHLRFPKVISGGISYRPTTNWNIEVDIDWTDWDYINNAVIDGFATIPLNWQSSFFYEIGVTRQLGKGYYVSAGYFFSESSTPERNYTPLVPDSDLHVGSLGVGHKGEHWTWAVAGQLIGGGFRTVDSAVDPTVNGKYRLFTPTVSFSVGYRF